MARALTAGLWRVSLALSLLRRAASEEEVCHNPLFQMHWFTQGGLTGALADAPGVHSNLRLCPAYDNQVSCCQEAFEQEQAVYFNYWKQTFNSKLERIRRSKEGAEAIQEHDVYSAATPSDRLQYRRALETYDQVLDPAGHSRCFAALLTYVAGMLCFACEAHWEERIELGVRGVIRVNIAENTCTELWACCEDFSKLAIQMRQAVLDSSLAIRQVTPMEHLAMFDDQQALCDWTHDAIAMHPFTTPGEAEREATPPIEALSRRMFEDAPVAEVKEYDAIKAGRASGFDVTWGGVVGTAAADPLAAAPALVLLLAAWAAAGLA